MYSRLARSIAPEIWGHEDVKKVADIIRLLTAGCLGSDFHLRALHLRATDIICQPDMQLVSVFGEDADVCVWGIGAGSAARAWWAG